METEIEFDGLMELHLEPSDLNYTCEILDELFFFEKDTLHRCQCLFDIM